jgi:hypothetical protein
VSQHGPAGVPPDRPGLSQRVRERVRCDGGVEIAEGSLLMSVRTTRGRSASV